MWSFHVISGFSNPFRLILLNSGQQSLRCRCPEFLGHPSPSRHVNIQSLGLHGSDAQSIMWLRNLRHKSGGFPLDWLRHIPWRKVWTWKNFLINRNRKKWGRKAWQTPANNFLFGKWLCFCTIVRARTKMTVSSGVSFAARMLIIQSPFLKDSHAACCKSEHGSVQICAAILGGSSHLSSL